LTLFCRKQRSAGSSKKAASCEQQQTPAAAPSREMSAFQEHPAGNGSSQVCTRLWCICDQPAVIVLSSSSMAPLQLYLYTFSQASLLQQGDMQLLRSSCQQPTAACDAGWTVVRDQQAAASLLAQQHGSIAVFCFHRWPCKAGHSQLHE
jgi:hypothetical protein